MANVYSPYPVNNLLSVNRVFSAGISLDKQGLQTIFSNLYRDLNTMSISINNKTSGIYVETPVVDGNQWFNIGQSNINSSQLRAEIRSIVNFGALPNTTTKSVAHNLSLSATTQVVNLYAVANNPTAVTALKIPYAHPTAANNIALDIDATNVNITTGNDRTAFTNCYVVIEFTFL